MILTYKEIKAIYFSHLTSSEQESPTILKEVDKMIAEDMAWQKRILFLNKVLRINEVAKRLFSSAKRFSNKLK